jgi:hypothetical protein
VSPTARRKTLLSIGWLLPPAVWFATLESNYLLADWVCARGHRWIYLAAALVASALIVAAAAVPVSRLLPLGVPAEAPDEGAPTMRRFLWAAALLIATASLLGVLALTLPGFFLRPCD